jgi:hypothetical protein
MDPAFWQRVDDVAGEFEDAHPARDWRTRFSSL